MPGRDVIKSSFFRVWVAVAVFLTLSCAWTRGCDVDEVCLGGRPRTPIGCCPVESGDDCGTLTGVECDVELGYVCLNSDGQMTSQRGVCSGRYNLHVTDTGSTSLTLEWIDFKPVNYDKEYLLQYKKDTYDTQWTELDIGTEASYTVKNLSPASVYFLRVAVWADDNWQVLGNTSEVLWTTTSAVSVCFYAGSEVEVGSTVETCEDRCTCLHTGHMNCTPVCPPVQLPHVPEGCSLVYEGEECSCPTPILDCPSESENVTRPPEGEICVYNGRNHSEGSDWTDTEECLSCTCVSGHSSCEYACDEQPEVPPGCINPRTVREANGCCQIVVCESYGPIEGEEECEYNGTVYYTGDTFISNCSLCVCQTGNNVSCAFQDCPQVDLPMPSIMCPFPNISNDGCCPMAVCWQPDMDPQTLMNRLMAISFSPNTLTISFQVDHHASSSSSSNPTTRDQYEVMTSPEGGDSESWRRSVYTASTLDSDDNVSSPSEFLHADAAIQVEDRVFITISSLNPNTSYYVRVRPVVRRDGPAITTGTGGEDSQNGTQIVGQFVARTSVQTDCLIGDEAFRDGSVVSSTCQEVCTCRSGQVICQRACPEESVELTSSSSCPRPLLVPSHNPCCRTWQCFPEEGGCQHRGMMMRNGERLILGTCQQECTCTEGEVTCTSVCPSIPPPPRGSCLLANITGSCCPVWMCPLETRAAIAVSLTMQISFEGSCPSNQAFFLPSFARSFQRLLAAHLTCADPRSPLFVTCKVKDVGVVCPFLESNRRQQQTTEIKVTAVVSANITQSNSVEILQRSLNATSEELVNLFASRQTLSLELEGWPNFTSSGPLSVQGIVRDCDSGFVVHHNSCIPAHFLPPALPLQQRNVTLFLSDVTHDTATLLWDPLSLNALSYVTGFVIEVREMTSFAWNWSVTLSPVSTRHTVTHLSPLRHYVARLVVLTNFTSASRWTLSVTTFRTSYHEVLNGTLVFNSLRVSLGVTSANIQWTSLPDNVTSVIQELSISYRPSGTPGNALHLDLDPASSHVKLVGLSSEKAYVSRFVVVLINGTTINTPPLHFVTAVEENNPILIPLVVTCVILVTLCVILAVSYYVWRRMRRKSTGDMAFENRGYGITITSLCPTRAKNESARPQDPQQNAAGAAPVACIPISVPAATTPTTDVSDHRAQA